MALFWSGFSNFPFAWLLASFCPFVGGAFENCDYKLELVANQKFYINSPGYPDRYPPGSSCRFFINAPLDHTMKITCDIEMTSKSTSRCSDDVFYFNSEGSKRIPNSEFFCGSGRVERKSHLNHAVISYISKPPLHSQSRDLNTFLQMVATKTSSSPPAEKHKRFHGKMEDENEDGDVENIANTRKRLIMNSSVPEFSPSVQQKLSNSSSEVRHSARITTRYVSDLSSGSVVGNANASALAAARIVAGLKDAPSLTSGEDDGSFSCLIEVQEPPCECGWSVVPKVAGQSSEASIDEFPPMVGLVAKLNKRPFCGATIIHHRYLISAAHCFQTPETEHARLIRAVVGEHDLTTVAESGHIRTYEIESIILHDGFISSLEVLINDIALLRTRSTIEWSRSVGPVCLPFPTATRPWKHLPLSGQRLDTAGWGTKSLGGPQSLRLLRTTLDVIPTDNCRHALLKLPPRTFCTYTHGTDNCQYDSGGALYFRGTRLYAVGIISYGFACATHQPSVNTRFSAFLKWIQKKTPEVSYCRK